MSFTLPASAAARWVQRQSVRLGGPNRGSEMCLLVGVYSSVIAALRLQKGASHGDVKGLWSEFHGGHHAACHRRAAAASCEGQSLRLAVQTTVFTASLCHCLALARAGLNAIGSSSPALTPLQEANSLSNSKNYSSKT